MDGRPRRVTLKRTAPHWQPPVCASAWGMAHGLHIVSVGIDHEGAVIVRVIMRARSGTAIIPTAIGHGSGIEGVDLGVVGGYEGIVTAGTGVRAFGQPEIRLVSAIAADLDATGV